MFCLSQSVGYAIRALAAMEATPGEKAFARDIAASSQVPPAYLAKVFKRLVDGGILESKRGWAGGTRLTRPSAAVSILEIAEAIDGSEWLNNCLLGMDACSEKRSCPTHDFWGPTREALRQKLRETTLADVVAYERGRDAESATEAQ